MSVTAFNNYNRVNWKNGPSGGTPWSAANLNIMDAGIKTNNDMIKGLIDDVTQLNNNKFNIYRTTITTDINGSVSATIPSFKIDCGLVTISFHIRGDNFGGVLIYCAGYFFSKISDSIHNDYNSAKIELDGNIVDPILKLSNGGSNRIYDISIVSSNINYI